LNQKYDVQVKVFKKLMVPVQKEYELFVKKNKTKLNKGNPWWDDK